ncbi:MAG: hypothetical protein JWM87_3270 [Candidatus Eremiobacteraeota bacterium]|nr:hypothetical protein [Candidatus Eremiobacteraeota bacterium]
MTTRRFDAPASNTPARGFMQREYARAEAAARRMVRLFCLTALLVRNDRASFAGYRRRFGIDMPTFRRDRRAVRQVQFYFEAYIFGDFRFHRYVTEADHE